MDEPDDDVSYVPFLEVVGSEGDAAHRIAISHVPFRIGRGADADLVIHSARVSKEHAEVDKRRERYVVRDLGSRNGTFVNGERVDESTPLVPGDVVHVAHRELRFQMRRPSSTEDATVSTSQIGDVDVAAMRDCLQVLRDRAVTAAFQPIVRLADGATLGAEALGRHTLPGSSLGPADLLRFAAGHGRAIELSRMFRDVASEHAAVLPADIERVFFNLHPSEMADAALVESLADLPALVGPGRTAVVEVHEAAVTDLGAMALLRAELADAGIELAYDDFGAGQSRLMELAEVPPDFIKLDMSLVRGIEQSAPRRELVRALTKVMQGLGVRVLAEGIETDAERAVCVDLGVELGQGFYFARPASAVQLIRTTLVPV